MTNIEFVEPEQFGTRPAAAGQADTATGHRQRATPSARARGSAWLTALLWVLAAGLCVAAPFGRIYTITYGGRFDPLNATADGWGRPYGASTPATDHDTRYGIVLWVIAALFLVVAALVLLAAYRLPAAARRPTAAEGLGLIASGVLVGVLASAALHMQAVYDSLQGQLDIERKDPSARSIRIDDPELHPGPMLWLGLAALLCAAAALALRHVPSVRRRGDPAPAPATASLTPDDEMLGAPGGDRRHGQ